MLVIADVPIQNPLGYIGRIPVKNLWLLMFYASDLFRQIGQNYISVEDNPDDISDLVAEILAHAVEKRLHRNLSSGYRVREAELSRVRGRIDLLSTERRQLLARGKVACRFEELSVDTTRNRFVLSALEKVATVVSKKSLSHRCRILANGFKRLGVSSIRPSRTEVSIDRFGRNDSEDQLMIAAAKLAFDIALPTEIAGNELLPMLDREEVWIRNLYEKAVGGFYKVALPSQGWRVDTGKPFVWQIEKRTDGIDAILPSMRTDIILDHIGQDKRIVIDTKFNSIVTAGWYRDETLRSAYVYQIYAYLMSQNGSGNPRDQMSAGLLLHPSIGKKVDETVVIQGHPIRFATVDLSASSIEIRQQLLEVINFTMH